MLKKKTEKILRVTNISCSRCKYAGGCLEKEALRSDMERIHCNAQYVCGSAEAPVDDKDKEKKHCWCIINRKNGRKERAWI